MVDFSSAGLATENGFYVPPSVPFLLPELSLISLSLFGCEQSFGEKRAAHSATTSGPADFAGAQALLSDSPTQSALGNQEDWCYIQRQWGVRRRFRRRAESISASRERPLPRVPILVKG